MLDNEQKNNNISSAEMTALWRSAYKISGDNLSSLMVTPAGAKIANVLQTAPYSGFPAVTNAFFAAKELLSSPK